MQYMLDNTLSDLERYPLKCSDLIVIDTDKDIAPEKAAYGSSPNLIIKDLNCYGFNTDKFYSNIPIENVKWQPYQFKLMSIDPSGRGKDELAITIIGVLNGQLFLLKSEGLQEGYSPENLKHIAELAAEYKVNKIIIESNFGDGMFSSLLTPPCTLEEVRHNTQKERRIIDTLEPVMNQHRLIVGKDVIKEDSQSVEKYPAEIRREYFIHKKQSKNHTKKLKNIVKNNTKLHIIILLLSFINYISTNLHPNFYIFFCLFSFLSFQLV